MDDRNVLKVLRWGWGGDLPFERRGVPWVVFCLFTLEESTEKIGKHDDQPGNQNPGPEGGGQMERAELRQIVVISSGHSFPAQKEHGEIEDVKSDKHTTHAIFAVFR